jgi:hypothetical protein
VIEQLKDLQLDLALRPTSEGRRHQEVDEGFECLSPGSLRERLQDTVGHHSQFAATYLDPRTRLNVSMA